MIPFTADKDLTSAPFVGSVMGWHVSTTDATGANVLLRNGGASGAIYVDIRVPIDAGQTDGASVHFSASRPILFPKGLFVDVVAGTVVGAIDN